MKSNIKSFHDLIDQINISIKSIEIKLVSDNPHLRGLLGVGKHDMIDNPA